MFYYRSVIDRFVVIELLHDIQLTARISNSELGLKCISHLLTCRQVHVHLHYVICQYTDKNTFEQVISLTETALFLMSRAGSVSFPLITYSQCIIVNCSRARTCHLLELEPSCRGCGLSDAAKLAAKKYLSSFWIVEHLVILWHALTEKHDVIYNITLTTMSDPSIAYEDLEPNKVIIADPISTDPEHT
jgi:hypothetical protein